MRRNVMIRIFGIMMATGFLLLAGMAFADYNVTISDAAGANGAWSGGSPDVWTPSATGSNVSVADIQSRLIGNSVTINTSGGGSESGDIIVSSAITWNANTLALNAARDININSVMTASDNSSLSINTSSGTVRERLSTGRRVQRPGRFLSDRRHNASRRNRVPDH